MIEFLEKIDIQLFFFFNKTCSNPIFDILMPFITEEENLAPALLVLIILLLWKGGSKGRMAVLLIIPTILLADQISSSLVKPLVSRMRPCRAFQALGTVNALMGVKSSESFFSAHAANSFGVAMLFFKFYPKAKWWAFGSASAIAFSRIYVGVHYPFDVLAGVLFGLFCGYLVYAVYDMIVKMRAAKKQTVLQHE